MIPKSFSPWVFNLTGFEMLHLDFKYCTISSSFSQWKGGQFGGYFLSSPAGERNTGWERNKMRKEAVATLSEHQEAEELTSPNFLLEFHQTSGNWLVGVGEKKIPHTEWARYHTALPCVTCHFTIFFFIIRPSKEFGQEDEQARDSCCRSLIFGSFNWYVDFLEILIFFLIAGQSLHWGCIRLTSPYGKTRLL